MGKKIVRFANILLVLEIIAFTYYTVVTRYGDSSLLIWLLVGIPALCLAYLPLYWFGCLFQTVESIQADVEAIKKEQAAKPN